jgi:hypothetical protein
MPLNGCTFCKKLHADRFGKEKAEGMEFPIWEGFERRYSHLESLVVYPCDGITGLCKTEMVYVNDHTGEVTRVEQAMTACKCMLEWAQSGKLEGAATRTAEKWPLPSRYRDAWIGRKPEGWSDRYAHLYERAEAWARSDMPDSNVMLVGKPGCGKTHLACAIANFIRRERRETTLAYCSTPTLVTKLMDGFGRGNDESNGKIIRELSGVGVLVLDDWGKQRPTATVAQLLYELINGRYEGRQHTILTMNPNTEWIKAMDGSDMVAAVRSRLGESFELLHFPDLDLRQKLRRLS